jgi:hypothetical protein
VGAAGGVAISLIAPDFAVAARPAVGVELLTTSVGVTPAWAHAMGAAQTGANAAVGADPVESDAVAVGEAAALDRSAGLRGVGVGRAGAALVGGLARRRARDGVVDAPVAAKDGASLLRAARRQRW